MTAMPTQAPAAIQRLEKPALYAYSAPAMKVPEPIQVQTSVNTMTGTDSERPATMKSSWFFTCRARTKLKAIRTAK